MISEQKKMNHSHFHNSRLMGSPCVRNAHSGEILVYFRNNISAELKKKT